MIVNKRKIRSPREVMVTLNPLKGFNDSLASMAGG